jgi:hypothetical protein
VSLFTITEQHDIMLSADLLRQLGCGPANRSWLASCLMGEYASSSTGRMSTGEMASRADGMIAPNDWLLRRQA